MKTLSLFKLGYKEIKLVYLTLHVNTIDIIEYLYKYIHL